MDEYRPKDGPPAAPGEERTEASPALQSLGSRLQGLFREFDDARKPMEKEWLQSLRQFSGKYSPEEESKLKDNRSRVFIGLTRTKVVSAYSRIIDLLFQRGERFFSAEPTPVADLEPEVEVGIRQQALLDIMEESGGALYPDLVMQRRDEIRREAQKEVQREAQLRAADMEQEIDDQFVELKAEQKFKACIFEACVLGTGVVKAGGTRVEHRKQYIQGSDGRWQVAYTKVPRPELESASIFDAFPSPYATNQDDLDEFFYRHRMTRSQFRDLGSNPGFDSDTINEIIADRPNGTTVEDELEDARRKAAGQDATAARDRRYQVLEFWGSLSGKDLVDHGVGRCEEEYEALDESERSEILERAKERGEKLILLDKNSDYAANVWICAGRVLMARLSPVPDGRIPYKLVPYETVPHQILGTGIPAMMRDSQSTMNAAVRIFLDNLAISSGPMLEVNEELLASGEDPTDIYPWRVFLRDGGDPGAQAVRFYQPQTNNSGLSSVIEIFRRFADETTSLPSYTHGQQTDSLNETATGASMLMTAANVALKSTVRNIDDFLLEPVVHEMYDWNMEWSTKEWIKGDFRCRARGSTALVQKELQSQRLIQFFNIIATSPELAARSDIDQLLRDLAKSMDLDPDRLLPEERLNVQAQPGGVPGGPAPPEQVPGGVATPVGAPS